MNLSDMSFAEEKYSPLDIAKEGKIQVLDLNIKDKKRRRVIPLRVYLPAEKTSQPVLIFSHGLGGSCKGNAYLGQHWASRGYMVVFLQHPGSDTSVWKGKPLLKRMAEMKKAASLNNFLLRVNDVKVLIDYLGKWNKQKGHALASRMDLKKIGMSGHSFGAVTTQALSGQRTAWGKASFTDNRIKAAVMFSPSLPSKVSAEKAFGKIAIPWMLMTGSKDDSFVTRTKAKERLQIYPVLPVKGKYELVLYNAEHSAFSDRSLPGDKEKRNPNHHRAILAFSTAFWDTWLKENKQAQIWLEGDKSKYVLETQDRWQFK